MRSGYVLVIFYLLDHTLDVCEVAEKAANVEPLDMLEAGPSNVKHKPESLGACEPSRKTNCNPRLI